MRSICIAVILMLCILISPAMVLAEEQDTKGGQELLERLDILEKKLKTMEEEAKARKSLEVTEEEKVEKEKEVLDAVGREYTLSPKGTFSLDYSLNYQYSPAERFSTSEQASTAALTLTAHRQSDHTITHTLYTSYSNLDNLSTSLSLPIVYRYNKMGTDQKLDQSDIGDISLGLAFQAPSKWTWLKLPGDIRNTYSIGASLPTGRSPYKINPDTELSTGNGTYSINAGSSFSKQLDPVVVFWGLSFSYPFTVKNLNYKVQDQVTLTKVDLGNSLGFNMGLGYALSYANSINMSFSYNYGFSSKYFYKEVPNPVKTGDSVSASFNLGTGIMINPKTTMSVSVGYSLVSTGFSLYARLPFDFAL